MLLSIFSPGQLLVRRYNSETSPILSSSCWQHSTEVADFTGIRQSLTLTASQPTREVPFNIIDDAIAEIDESFTATIAIDAERVTVSVPSTTVIITDNDSKLVRYQLASLFFSSTLNLIPRRS